MLLFLLLSACDRNLCREVGNLPNNGDVLSIGDSIQAWAKPRCHSVPDHLALARGGQVENHAVNGTRMINGEDRIPDQYTPGSWDWVIVDGGGNDLNSLCGCGDCAQTLDQIVTQDGLGGEMPSLIQRIQADGPKVVLLGYYPLTEESSYGFDRCGPTMDSLKARYVTLAAANPALLFVDMAEVMDPVAFPEGYDFDWVHPSEAGAEVIGDYIHQQMLAFE